MNWWCLQLMGMDICASVNQINTFDPAILAWFKEHEFMANSCYMDNRNYRIGRSTWVEVWFEHPRQARLFQLTWGDDDPRASQS